MKNISNGYEDISVEIIDFEKDIARHVWNCYRMTWKHLQDVEYAMPTDSKLLDYTLNMCRFAKKYMAKRYISDNFNILSMSEYDRYMTSLNEIMAALLTQPHDEYMYSFFSKPGCVLSVPVDCYSSYHLQQFEETAVLRIPVGYDTILRRLYGDDYMIERKDDSAHAAMGKYQYDPDRSYKQTLEELQNG